MIKAHIFCVKIENLPSTAVTVLVKLFEIV